MTAGKLRCAFGFTLIELVVALAVFVILATVAVPGFQRMLASNRLSADHNEILAGVNFARSEAIKRRESVVFEIASDSPWRYEIYSVTGDGDVLRSRDARDNRVNVTQGSVTFNPLGRRESCTGWGGCVLAVSFNGQMATGIEVGLSGRVSKTDGTSGPSENEDG